VRDARASTPWAWAWQPHGAGEDFPQDLAGPANSEEGFLWESSSLALGHVQMLLYSAAAACLVVQPALIYAASLDAATAAHLASAARTADAEVGHAVASLHAA